MYSSSCVASSAGNSGAWTEEIPAEEASSCGRL